MGSIQAGYAPWESGWRWWLGRNLLPITSTLFRARIINFGIWTVIPIPLVWRRVCHWRLIYDICWRCKPKPLLPADSKTDRVRNMGMGHNTQMLPMERQCLYMGRKGAFTGNQHKRCQLLILEVSYLPPSD